MAAMLVLLAFVAAFFLGSIPTGVIVARCKGIDLRRIGSGNIGATNVGRALGRKWAALVLVADAGKGALPVLLCHQFRSDPWLPAAGALGAVLGQVFSVFLRGRGGKGVATSLGAGLALAPLPALACVVVFIVVFSIARIVSVGSLAAVACYPVALWVSGLATRPRLAFAVVVFVLVVVRHRDNLMRLRRGEESRA